jgi:hypothetical protein
MIIISDFFLFQILPVNENDPAFVNGAGSFDVIGISPFQQNRSRPGIKPK